MMTVQENYLFSLEAKGIRLGLERTQELLKKCGNPHKKVKAIQIIGTNGKGSTSAILSKLLNLKYKVGLYTSPHLYSFKERIRVNGRTIPTNAVEEFIDTFQLEIEKIGASFFEVMTVMAVWYFKESNVEYAIMETGLGGRFDSVTACNANIFGFTSISMDHAHILGNNLRMIAKEKIAAIQKNAQVYSVKQRPITEALITKKCIERRCSYHFIKTDHNIDLALSGEHQKENASLAIAIANNILDKMSKKKTNECLMSINWHGRNQVIKRKPDIIFDVAHNESGLKSFSDFIETNKNRYNKKTLLLSIQKEKKIQKACKKLNLIFDDIIYSKTDAKRSMPYQEIKNHFSNIQYIENPNQALSDTIRSSKKNDLIAIVGTHHWGNAIKSFFNICFDNI